MTSVTNSLDNYFRISVATMIEELGQMEDVPLMLSSGQGAWATRRPDSQCARLITRLTQACSNINPNIGVIKRKMFQKAPNQNKIKRNERLRIEKAGAKAKDKELIFLRINK